MKKLILPAIVLLALSGCAAEAEVATPETTLAAAPAAAEPVSVAELCESTVRMHETADSYYPDYNTAIIEPELKLAADAAQLADDEDLAKYLSFAYTYVLNGAESDARTSLNLAVTHCEREGY